MEFKNSIWMLSLIGKVLEKLFLAKMIPNNRNRLGKNMFSLLIQSECYMAALLVASLGKIISEKRGG